MRERSDRPASNADASRYGTPASVPYQTVYHWDRIAVALLVVVALLAGLGYLGARFLGDDPADEPRAETSRTATTSAAAVAPAATPAEPAPSAGEQAPSADEQAAVAPSTQRAEKRALQSPASPPADAIEAPAATATADAPQASEAPATAKAPETAEASEAAETSETPEDSGAEIAAPSEVTPAPAVPATRPASPAPADSDAVTTAAPSDPSASAATLPRMVNLKVETPSAAVVRAQFASGVRANEPAGEIAAIEPTESGLIRVYFFTEVKGRKGERLVYRWLRDGNRVATVAAGAWNNAWRSYSSKFIAPTQQGHWRVELVDSRDNVLAAGSFDYTLAAE